MKPLVIKGRKSDSRASLLEVEVLDGLLLAAEMDEPWAQDLYDHLEQRGSDLILHKPTRNRMAALEDYVLHVANSLDDQIERARKNRGTKKFDPEWYDLTLPIMKTARTLHKQVLTAVWKRQRSR